LNVSKSSHGVGNLARSAADDLDDLGQAAAVADGQCMLAPDPVKPFLCHAECYDDVDMIAVSTVRRVLKRGRYRVPLGGIVVDQIGNLDRPPLRQLDQMEARDPIDTFPGAERRGAGCDG
jgi:hypothetical protein